jgi:hypothetical protein
MWSDSVKFLRNDFVPVYMAFPPVGKYAAREDTLMMIPDRFAFMAGNTL